MFGDANKVMEGMVKAVDQGCQALTLSKVGSSVRDISFSFQNQVNFFEKRLAMNRLGKVTAEVGCHNLFLIAFHRKTG